MSRFLALPGNIASKIIPHCPAFFNNTVFLHGIIRIDHWLATQPMTPLQTWAYLNDNLPRYFIGFNELFVDSSEWWTHLDRYNMHGEIFEATSRAISASYPLLEPILSCLPPLVDFSYVDRGITGVYLEIHHHD